jgi:serine acetyltransferase
MSAEPSATNIAAADAPAETAPEREYGLLELIRSDYTFYCDLLQEPQRTRKIKAPVRLLINTSLRAGILFRITCASPRWMHWFWRSVLNSMHACEVVYGAKIGPGLHLPHPYGIGIGGQVRIGHGVTICQNVTLGSDMGATGQPQLGNNVAVFAGAVALGPIRIGNGAVVGANSVLEEDLVDGGLCAPARTRIVNRRINWKNHPVQGREAEVNK